MSFLDTLNKMRELGKEYSGGGQGVVTKIKIDFAFYAYPGAQQERLKYFKVVPPGVNKDVSDKIKAEIEARMAADKYPPSDRGKLNFCLHVWCSKDVAGRDAFDYDQNGFYPEWQLDRDRDGNETCGSLIIKNIEEKGLPVYEEFWGRYVFEPNPYHVAQGESAKVEKVMNDGTTRKFWPSFVLPVEAYANEDEARAAAQSGSGSQKTANNASQWSDKARGDLFPDGISEKEQAEIFEWYQKVLSGTPWPGQPLPYTVGMSESLKQLKTKQFIANQYQIETSDMDIILLDKVF